jgi:hypothetical protein
VGFERSMWTVVQEDHVIFITDHIDDFIIACADRRVCVCLGLSKIGCDSLGCGHEYVTKCVRVLFITLSPS